MPADPSKHSSEAELKDESPDRWPYNLFVFFLLLPFSVFVSYVIGSPIVAGFGVALAAWRAAVTPEITNHISLRISGRSRRFLQDLFIGLVAGFTLLGVSDFATQITVRNFRWGFPLSFTQPVAGPCSPGPFGCPIVYDPVTIFVDYLFWVGVAFAFVSVFRATRIRLVA